MFFEESLKNIEKQRYCKSKKHFQVVWNRVVTLWELHSKLMKSVRQLLLSRALPWSPKKERDLAITLPQAICCFKRLYSFIQFFLISQSSLAYNTIDICPFCRMFLITYLPENYGLHSGAAACSRTFLILSASELVSKATTEKCWIHISSKEQLSDVSLFVLITKCFRKLTKVCNSVSPGWTIIIDQEHWTDLSLWACRPSTALKT